MAELKRAAGYGTIIALTITSVMGSGLFMGPAIGAKLSGVASILAWLILTIVSIYVASCFGELVAMFPKAGGIYEFSKQTYGRFFSFIIGWLTWLVGNIMTVVLIVAAVDYLLPGSKLMWLKIVITAMFLLLLNLITLMGIEGSSAMVIIFTVIILVVILSVAVPGIGLVKTANYFPFFTTRSLWFL
jgi:amino acid transporter